MKISAITAIFAACLLVASCSKQSEADRDGKRDDADKKSREELAEGKSSSEDSDEEKEEEKGPDSGDVGEDCVAFLRATTAGVGGRNGECPQCPTNYDAPEVLRVNDVKIDHVSSSPTTCEVAVRIFATFNPSKGGEIVGGLTKWISPEQKARYARGETPPGQQVYKVTVTYRRTAKGWQPVEFN